MLFGFEPRVPHSILPFIFPHRLCNTCRVLFWYCTVGAGFVRLRLSIRFTLAKRWKLGSLPWSTAKWPWWSAGGKREASMAYFIWPGNAKWTEYSHGNAWAAGPIVNLLGILLSVFNRPHLKLSCGDQPQTASFAFQVPTQKRNTWKILFQIHFQTINFQGLAWRIWFQSAPNDSFTLLAPPWVEGLDSCWETEAEGLKSMDPMDSSGRFFSTISDHFSMGHSFIHSVSKQMAWHSFFLANLFGNIFIRIYKNQKLGCGDPMDLDCCLGFHMLVRQDPPCSPVSQGSLMSLRLFETERAWKQRLPQSLWWTNAAVVVKGSTIILWIVQYCTICNCFSAHQIDVFDQCRSHGRLPTMSELG